MIYVLLFAFFLFCFVFIYFYFFNNDFYFLLLLELFVLRYAVTRTLYTSLGLRNFSLTMGLILFLSHLPYRNWWNNSFCQLLTQEAESL